MNYIEKSGLPENKVKFLICDNRVEKNILSELDGMGINTIFVTQNKNLDAPVSSHADMNVFHIGGYEFITSTEYNETFNKIIIEKTHCENFHNWQVAKNISKEYPGDVKLNAVILNEYIICNKKTVDDNILNLNKKIINVSQGYTKCSTAIVSNYAIITDDESIYKSTKNILDVLLIKKGSVLLNGYNYGFIGGCCGKVSKNHLAFTGNIKLCSDYDNIKAFCNNHHVDLISLSSNNLYDYGSLIPIIEE